MNASDYLDQQIAVNPTQGMSAAAYLDQQVPSSSPPQDQGVLHSIMDSLNAPIAGIDNAFANTAIGAVQGGSALANKAGLMSDDTLANVRSKINDLQQMRKEDTDAEYQGEPIASGLNTGGNLIGSAAQFAMMPGVGSSSAAVAYPANIGAGALLSASQPVQDESQRLFNAGIGGVTGGLGKGLGDMLSTQVTNPDLAESMQTASDYDIPLYRNQVSNSKFVKGLAKLLQNVPGSGAGAARDAQVGAFQNAIGGEVGLPDGPINSTTLGNAFDKLGTNYDQVTQNPFIASPNFDASIQQLKDQAARSLPAGLDKERTFTHFANSLNNVPPQALNANGQVNGDYVKGLISDIRTEGRGTNSSPQLNQLATEINKQWASGMPSSDAALTNLTDQQYRNGIALEGPVGNNPNGPLNPTALQGGVKRVFDNYATGGDSGLERLSRLGQLTKDSFPDSGTAFHEKAIDAAKHLGSMLAVGGIGAEAGHEAGGGDHTYELGGALAAFLGAKYGVSPYVFSKMSTNPSMIQGAAAPSAHALADYLMRQQ